jgi:CDP-diacylglycerol---glycerol-3-phosphate 3-phosphatidyltransferase
MRMTLPNIISLLRLIIAPIFFFLIISNDSEFVRLAVFLFILGAFTDYIDGWLARKFEVVTSLGKFVDPLADKFLTSAAFLAFVILKIVPLWMVLIIIIRDFCTTFLRVYTDYMNKQIVTSYSAKWKTFLQMLFITYLLILIYLRYSTLFHIPDVIINSILFSIYTWIGMLILTLITFWTLVEYLIKNYSIFKK